MLSREVAAEKVEGFCQVLEEALSIAHKDLDRLILARKLMSRVTAKIRSNSKRFRRKYFVSEFQLLLSRFSDGGWHVQGQAF
jgi:hypothetical protein